MPIDFSSKVAAMVASGPLRLPSEGAACTRPPLSQSLLREAAEGDTDAQVCVASHLFSLVRQRNDLDGASLEGAIEWARAAHNGGNDTASVLLVHVLAFRAGVLRELGMVKLAGLDAAETLNLCTDLADRGCEEASSWLVCLHDHFARTGFKVATADDLYNREIF